jgi:hypothetical protein
MFETAEKLIDLNNYSYDIGVETEHDFNINPAY